jgi:hypothetical protein
VLQFRHQLISNKIIGKCVPRWQLNLLLVIMNLPLGQQHKIYDGTAAQIGARRNNLSQAKQNLGFF